MNNQQYNDNRNPNSQTIPNPASMNPSLSFSGIHRPPAVAPGGMSASLPASPAQAAVNSLFPQDRAFYLGLAPDVNSLSQFRQLNASEATNLLASAQQEQQNRQNADLLRTYMAHKLPLPTYENQLLRQRLLGMPAAPLLQPPMTDEMRLIMSQTPLLGGLPTSFGPGVSSTSPNELPQSLANLNHFDPGRMARGGVIEPFPEKLHRLLLEVEAAGRSDVISFVSDGRAFSIHKPDTFFKEIVPQYFRQSRLSSFKRQLNLYGFELLNAGPDRGAYYHKFFNKDNPTLCRRMRRTPVKMQSKTSQSSDDSRPQEQDKEEEKPVAKQEASSGPDSDLQDLDSQEEPEESDEQEQGVQDSSDSQQQDSSNSDGQ